MPRNSISKPLHPLSRPLSQVPILTENVSYFLGVCAADVLNAACPVPPRFLRHFSHLRSWTHPSRTTSQPGTNSRKSQSFRNGIERASRYNLAKVPIDSVRQQWVLSPNIHFHYQHQQKPPNPTHPAKLYLISQPMLAHLRTTTRNHPTRYRTTVHPSL